MGKQERKKSIQEELEELAPALAKLKNLEQPLEVPANYFDQLSADVMQQIRQQEQIAAAPSQWQQWQEFWQRMASIWMRPSYAIALTGVIALIIGISILLPGNAHQDDLQIALSEEDIDDYINFNIDDFELSLFVEEEMNDLDPTDLSPMEDSIDEENIDAYFDELLDDIQLEDLL